MTVKEENSGAYLVPTVIIESECITEVYVTICVAPSLDHGVVIISHSLYLVASLYWSLSVFSSLYLSLPVPSGHCQSIAAS